MKSSVKHNNFIWNLTYGVSKANPISPRRTDSTEEGPRRKASTANGPRLFWSPEIWIDLISNGKTWKEMQFIIKQTSSVLLPELRRGSGIDGLPSIATGLEIGSWHPNFSPSWPIKYLNVFQKGLTASKIIYQAWKFQTASWLSPSGPPFISSPKISKYLSTDRVWLVSRAETKLVTGRDGIPKARKTVNI